jgi:hypothetical protein
MSTNLNPIQAGITTLQIDGVTITKDIARQLDELSFDDWENFEPLGRVRTGIAYSSSGIELLGRKKQTGALVRMWHVTGVSRIGMKYIMTTTADGRIRMQEPTLPRDDLRDTLTHEYGKLPLIALLK